MKFNSVRYQSVIPIAVMLVAFLLLTWTLLTAEGTIRGHDAAINSYAGYEAENSTWSYYWDDLRFPGNPRPATRTTLTQFVLIAATDAFDSVNTAARLMQAGFVLVSMVSVYLLVLHYTGSRVAGVVAALIYTVNRGAPFQSQLAFAAGYALLPLVILTVDRALNTRTLRDVILAGSVAALLSVSTILPFTYITAIIVVVYVVVFIAAKHRKDSPRDLLPRLAPTGLVLGGIVLISVSLGSYFLLTSFLSTGQIAQEESYTLEDVARRGVTVWQAITLEAAGGFLFDTALMSVSNFLLAIAAWIAVVRLRTYWAGGLLVVAGVSIFAASQVESPIYAFFFERMPLFSLVRIARRWEVFILLSHVVLASTLVPVFLEWSKARSIRSRWLHPSGITAGLFTLAVVPLLITAHWGGVSRWLTVYTLPDEFVTPYEWLAENGDDSVLATAPFLEQRIADEYSLVTGDYSRHFGPAVGNQRLLTGFRVGGIDVNQGMRDLISHMETSPVLTLDSVVPAGTVVPVVERRWRNFYLRGQLKLGEQIGTGTAEILFRSQSDTIGYAVVVDGVAGEIRLERQSARPLVLDATAFETTPGRSLEIAVAAQDSQFRVYVDGKRLLAGTDDAFDRGVISVSGGIGTAEFSDLRMTSVLTPIFLDTSFMKKLGLLNVGHLVLQPHASPEEKAVLRSLPGFESVFVDGVAEVGRNELVSSTLMSPELITVIPGDPSVETTSAFLEIPNVDINHSTVVYQNDMSDFETQQLLALADLVLVPTSAELEPEFLSTASRLNVPVTYLLDDTETSGESESSPVFEFERIDLSPEEVQPIVRNWRVFVLEAEAIAEDPDVQIVIRFRQRSATNFNQLTLDFRAGQALIERQQGRGRVVLESAALGSAADSVGIRLAVDGSTITLFLDGIEVISVEDDRYQRGPVSFSADRPSAALANLIVSSPQQDSAEFDFLKENGFRSNVGDFQTSTEGFGDQRIERLSSTVNVVAAGDYAVVARLEGSGNSFSFASVTNQSTGSEDVVLFDDEHLQTTTYFNELTGEQESDSWLVSEPVTLQPGVQRVEVASGGFQPRVTRLMLVQTVDPTSNPLVSLFGTENRDSVSYQNVNPTHHIVQLEESSTEDQMIVFKDTFDDHWRATSEGEELPQFRAFGMFNGYLVGANRLGTDESTGKVSVDIEHTSQGTYRAGLTVSLLALLVIASVFALTTGPARPLRVWVNNTFGPAISKFKPDR